MQIICRPVVNNTQTRSNICLVSVTHTNTCKLAAQVCTLSPPKTTCEDSCCLFFIQNGEKSRNPGEFDCPPGWMWEDEWTVDDNRAVDDQGVNICLICRNSCSDGKQQVEFNQMLLSVFVYSTQGGSTV